MSVVMRCVAVAALCVLFYLPVPAKAGLLVEISKSQQRLAVVIDGAETYRWPVSTGRRGHATPAGTFHPTRLERHWYSHQYSMTPMPWSVFFHRGYAVHGTMEAYNLGHAASHGCVRLRPDNAAILYWLVRRHGMRGTKVVVMNGPLPAPAGARPMAEVETPKADEAALSHFAEAPASEPKVTASEHEEYAAKRHRASLANEDGESDDVGARRAARFAHTLAYRVSVSNDEAQILRERDAWLRSLDRKYGITH